MINKILIEGMTCNKCKSYLENKLNELDFIKDVEVSLENKMAFIESDEFDYEKVKQTIEEKGTYKVKECVCNHKLKPRSEDDKKKIKSRINRVIGQLQGVSKMIDEDRYCNDILIQLQAIISSCKSISNIILDEHLNSCIKENIERGNTNIISEIQELIKRVK